MLRSEILSELLKLGALDRIQLAEDLWDSIADRDLPLTETQAAELVRRTAELASEPSIGITWEEVRTRLQERFG